jgi:hypothetical protein
LPHLVKRQPLERRAAGHAAQRPAGFRGAGADQRKLELASDGPFDSSDVALPAFVTDISQDAPRVFLDAHEALATSDSDTAYADRGE